MITEGESAQELLDDLNSKIEEAQNTLKESKNELEIEPTSEETQEPEQVTVEEQKELETQTQPATKSKKVKKARRVIVE